MADHFDLTRVPIFRRLTPEESDRLKSGMEERLYRKDELIFKQGDPPDYLFIVKSGHVDISIQSENGEVAVATFGAGNFFGELGLFDNAPRSATARAQQDTTVLVLKRDAVVDFLQQNPSASLRILSVVTSRLRHADQMMTRLVTRNVNELLEAKLTFGERLADKVASFGGSWTFIILFGVTLLTWMGINTAYFLWRPFDPFPFIFLNLMLSCLAALQAPIIMMSQNRQSAKDRLRSELDFQVNLKSEIAIQQLHRKLDELRENPIRELENSQREQLQRIDELLDSLKNK